jgi:hypothetical protein
MREPTRASARNLTFVVRRIQARRCCAFRRTAYNVCPALRQPQMNAHPYAAAPLLVRCAKGFLHSCIPRRVMKLQRRIW